MYKPFIDHNMKKLKDNHAQIFCEIDATKLNTEEIIKKLDPENKKFDRIVWNFPHAGFPDEQIGPGFEWSDETQQKHTSIIQEFFHASQALLSDNEHSLIIMSNKTIEPFSLWDLPGMAEKAGLILRHDMVFEPRMYPLYENRKGIGKNAATKFPCDDAVTYAFGRKSDWIGVPQEVAGGEGQKHLVVPFGNQKYEEEKQPDDGGFGLDVI